MKGSNRSTSEDMSAMLARIEVLEKYCEKLLVDYAGLRQGNQQLLVIQSKLLERLGIELKDLIEEAPPSQQQSIAAATNGESEASQRPDAATPPKFTAPPPPPPPPPPLAPEMNGESKASSKGSSTEAQRGAVFDSIKKFGGVEGLRALKEAKKQENEQEPANGSEDQAQSSNDGSASNQESASGSEGQSQPQNGGGGLMAELARTLKARKTSEQVTGPEGQKVSNDGDQDQLPGLVRRNTLRKTDGPRTGAVKTKEETSAVKDEKLREALARRYQAAEGGGEQTQSDSTDGSNPSAPSVSQNSGSTPASSEVQTSPPQAENHGSNATGAPKSHPPVPPARSSRPHKPHKPQPPSRQAHVLLNGDNTAQTSTNSTLEP